MQKYLPGILFFLLTVVVGLAQAPTPEVEAVGAAVSGGEKYTILKTSQGSRITKQGARLGDYSLEKVSSDSVVFRYGNQTFPIKYRGFRLPSGPTKRGKTVSVAGNLPRLRAAQLITRALGRDSISDPWLKGNTKIIVHNKPLKTALRKALGFVPPERDGILLIAKGVNQKAVLQARAIPSLSGSISLDYVNADLKYVLDLMAKEAGLQLKADTKIEGAVTAYVKSGSVAKLLPQILALQYNKYSARVEGGSLVISGKR